MRRQAEQEEEDDDEAQLAEPGVARGADVRRVAPAARRAVDVHRGGRVPRQRARQQRMSGPHHDRTALARRTASSLERRLPLEERHQPLAPAGAARNRRRIYQQRVVAAAAARVSLCGARCSIGLLEGTIGYDYRRL